MRVKSKFYITLFWIWSLVWNALVTWVGLIVALVLLCAGYKPKTFCGFLVFEVGKNWGGINLGGVILVAEYSNHTSTLQHEVGHGLQGLVFGPLFLFVVAIPSVIRYHYFNYISATNPKKYLDLDYESIWFEGTASKYGERYYSYLYTSSILWKI